MPTLRTVLVLGFLAAVFAVVPAGATNTTTYQDSTGEPNVKADIGAVVASNDDTGTITIRINATNVPVYTTDIAVEIYADTDNTATTGSADIPGIDYVIQLFNGEINLFKWDGTDFTRRFGDPPAASLIYQWANGVGIKISAAELGNTKKMRFLVDVITGITFDPITGNPDFTNSLVDFAPNLGNFYTYEVKIAPARLVAKTPSTTPAKPKAGKTFTVRMTATRSDTGATIVNGEVDCAAKAGNKTVKPKSEKFVGGQAVCVFQIPAGTQGKTLRGTIKIVFEGKSVTRPFAGQIG